MRQKAFLTRAAVLSVILLKAVAPGTAHAQTALTCLGASSAPSISGLYFDNFAGIQLVSAGTWISGMATSQFISHLCSVDNAKNYLIGQNDPGNPGDASDHLKYTRFEWFSDGTHLFYCEQVYHAPTASEAEDFTKNPAAKTDDPKSKGCGENGHFPWTEMILVRK